MAGWWLYFLDSQSTEYHVISQNKTDPTNTGNLNVHYFSLVGKGTGRRVLVAWVNAVLRYCSIEIRLLGGGCLANCGNGVGVALAKELMSMTSVDTNSRQRTSWLSSGKWTLLLTLRGRDPLGGVKTDFNITVGSGLSLGRAALIPAGIHPWKSISWNMFVVLTTGLSMGDATG